MGTFVSGRLESRSSSLAKRLYCLLILLVTHKDLAGKKPIIQRCSWSDVVQCASRSSILNGINELNELASCSTIDQLRENYPVGLSGHQSSLSRNKMRLVSRSIFAYGCRETAAPM
ncbi:hypothetical protein F5X98DRAFT_388700 [Xylaria grammica]|nr:hypothetical protein F5X98DRAFT_388700 [Xylaria grammica]